MEEFKITLDYIIKYLETGESVKSLKAELSAVRKALDGVPECYADDLIKAVFGGNKDA